MRFCRLSIPLLALSIIGCTPKPAQEGMHDTTTFLVAPSAYSGYMLEDDRKAVQLLLKEDPVYSGPTEKNACEKVPQMQAALEIQEAPKSAIFAISALFNATIKIEPKSSSSGQFKIYAKSFFVCQEHLELANKVHGIVLTKFDGSQKATSARPAPSPPAPAPMIDAPSEPWYNVSADGRRCVPTDMAPAQRIEWLRERGVKYDAIDHAGLKVNGRVRKVTIIPRTGSYPTWEYYGDKSVCEEAEVAIEKYR